jgi:rhamnosyltransferase
MMPSVSICLLMKNELASLERSWDRIADQAYEGPVEYVYIDSGSTDGTLDFMRARGVEPHEIPPAEFHHGRTRNLAASLATHEILVYLSGDAIPLDRHWLAHLVTPFEDPAMGGTYGRQVAPEGIGPLRRFTMEQEYPETGEVRDLSAVDRVHLGLFRMSNANSAYRRAVWERFRFSERVLMSEDMGMCRDILTNGMKVAYVPGAAVWHCHEKALWYEFQKAFDSGWSLTRLGILGNPAYGRETAYGARKALGAAGHFLRRGRPVLAARSVVHSGARWLGVQLGKRADVLPGTMTRRISAGVEKMRE